MNDTYFYAGDSSPMTGKVPVQARFHGESAAIEAVRGAANSALSTFLGSVRLGSLSQLRSTVNLPGGGSIQMVHTFGVTSVDVYAPGSGQPRDSAFYGGIVVEPTILLNEAAYLTTSAARSVATLEAAKSSGATSTLSGRPAVPGSKTLETERLVIQIHPTKPLTGSPIQSGAVRIFRIRQPKIGDLYDPDSRAGYVVSTVTPGAEFYVCGKVMTNVPALPTALTAQSVQLDARARTDLRAVSLHAVDLQITDFAHAATAEAILVVVVATPPALNQFGIWTFRLYALDTKSRTRSTPAAWQLLDTTTSPDAFRPNAFGTTFTDVRVPTRTITCSGTNGIGPCSGWQLVIASDGALSGSLAVVSDLSTPAVAATRTSTYTAEYRTDETEDVDSALFVYSTYSEDPGPTYSYLGPQTYLRYVGYKAAGFRESHSYTFDISGGDLGSSFDSFLGGPLPIAPTAEIHYEGIGSTTCTLASFNHRLKGTGLVNPDTGTLGIYDNQSSRPIAPPDTGLYVEIDYSTEPLYLGFYERLDFYGPETGFDFGETYQFTWEYSGLYDPVGHGISLPDPPTALPLYSVPAYYLYNLNGDGSDPDPLFEKYPYVPPVPAYQDIPDESSTLIYDTQPIFRYPKKAAIFDCDERWESTVSVSGGSPFDGLFNATASRVGQTRADEYLANMWPTNVDAFPDLAPATFSRIDDGDLLPAMSGEFTHPPFMRYGYSARDALTNKLAWRWEQQRSGTWTYEPPETMTGATISFSGLPQYTENAGVRRLPIQLMRPDGSVILSIDDLFALFPRPPSGAAAGSQQDVTVPINIVGRRQWPLRYNDPEHPEYDDTRLVKFPYTATNPDSSHWATVTNFHRFYPQLTTAYWGRSATGEEFSPRFPALRYEPPASNTIDYTSSAIDAAPSTVALIPGRLTTGGAAGTAGTVFGGNTRQLGDLIYYDPRTGGFLATINWRDFDQSVIETYIGNATGAVPLKPILDEWVALGSVPAQAFTKILLSRSFGTGASDGGSPPITTTLL